MTSYFFTSDEHFGHKNIIKYCNRPWSSVELMDEVLIDLFNKKVSKSLDNVTIHCGDFTFAPYAVAMKKYVDRLNGRHIFLRGSHDKWLGNDMSFHRIYDLEVDGQLVIACHYAMRTWPRSHHNSWHVFGHSHGNLEPFGKSYDVGVDNNQYQPVSWDELVLIMNGLEDNFNLVPKDNPRRINFKGKDPRVDKRVEFQAKDTIPQKS